MNQCRGQSNDGAANMAKSIKGVAKCIQNEQPLALFLHCLAHNLNLCLQNYCPQCLAVKNALNLTSGFTTIILASPKRLRIFKHLQEEFNVDVPGLKPLCPTRLTVRTSAINSILKNYDVICTELEQVSNESRDSATHASGYTALMEKFETLFGLCLSYLVFSATEEVSKVLQGHDLNAQDVCRSVAQAISFLTRQRSDVAFSEFYQTTLSKSKNLTDPPKLSRANSIIFTSPEIYFRQQYFQVLDLLISELERRFHQPSLSVFKDTEKLLMTAF